MTGIVPDPLYPTLIDALRDHVRKKPDFTIVEVVDYRGMRSHITAQQLNERACKLASFLKRHCQPGDRVLLPTGNELSFHVAMMACFYAGCVAVPLQAPRLKKKLPDLGIGRFVSVARDCGATLALVDQGMAEEFSKIAEALAEVEHLLPFSVIQQAEADGGETLEMECTISPDALAFLQYTSGSTSHPKGVMLTHRAIVENQRSMQRRYKIRDNSTSVSWLPMYHDMGLCSGFFMPIYLGMKCVVMSPLGFIARPESWLAEISLHEDVLSGGPNFSFAHCLSRIKSEYLSQLDVSSWRVAYCGAEPIRPAVIRDFCDKFAASGFKAAAFCPAYGLAEGTVFVSAKCDGEAPVTEQFSLPDLSDGIALPAQHESIKTIELMSCGREYADIGIVIVDPGNLQPVDDGRIGEILVHSPSAGTGFWNNEESSRQTFGLTVPGHEGKPFFRTGDLGFKHNGELYISGRIKELIIINGVNYYPQDIEFIAQSVDPSLALLKAAAFSPEGDEKLVLVMEADPKKLSMQVPALREAARSAVRQEYQIVLADIQLVKPGEIPRTTSGKVQRMQCQKLYGNGQFDCVDVCSEKESIA